MTGCFSETNCVDKYRLSRSGYVKPKYQKSICSQVYEPSWKVENVYSANVLVNNWSEERHDKFKHPDYFTKFPKTTTQSDYLPPCDRHELCATKRYLIGMRQLEGALPTDQFFRHHGKKYDCNKITWYDETYNGRRLTDHGGQMKFPVLRTWSVGQNQWRPEQTDFPLQGNSTNWGLYENRLEADKKLRSNQDFYASEYQKSFGTAAQDGSTKYQLTRLATPRAISFKYNRQDTVGNRDTNFSRGKQPESLWHIDKSPGLCEPRHPPAELYD